MNVRMIPIRPPGQRRNAKKALATLLAQTTLRTRNTIGKRRAVRAFSSLLVYLFKMFALVASLVRQAVSVCPVVLARAVLARSVVLTLLAMMARPALLIHLHQAMSGMGPQSVCLC